jgi:hypothetical protein
MSDPMTLDKIDRQEGEGAWTERLVWYLRIMAGVSMCKGLVHWAAILGAMDTATWSFETASLPWKAATILFAVIDLVAAVGLWLAAAWGGVVWLTAAISMAAVELFFPQFGGWLVIAFAELAAISGYLILAMLAARERPQ